MPMQDITIYHYDKTKDKWILINAIASFRDTTTMQRSDVDLSSVDNTLVRVFVHNNSNFSNILEVDKEDVIVNKSVNDVITDKPISTLQAIYGKNNVYKINAITKNIYGTSLDHIKYNCV
jgi:hypothetical protein